VEEKIRPGFAALLRGEEVDTVSGKGDQGRVHRPL